MFFMLGTLRVFFFPLKFYFMLRSSPFSLVDAVFPSIFFCFCGDLGRNSFVRATCTWSKSVKDKRMEE